MKTLTIALSLALAAPMLSATSAAAQDDIDIDIEDEGKKKKKKARAPTVAADEIVREIERGWYIKAGAGGTSYLLRYGAQPAGGNLINFGSVVSASVGNDFVDEPNRSMAWDVQFYQAIHNGTPYDQQRAQGVAAADHIQGDIRSFALLAAYEFSTYPSRRVGVGFRAGAGIMFLPLLMPKQYFDSTVVGEWGTAPSIHSTPHFPVFAGPTVEYYTKLSHFSVGIDVDAMFVIGMNDLGVTGTGFMKYTF